MCISRAPADGSEEGTLEEANRKGSSDGVKSSQGQRLQEQRGQSMGWRNIYEVNLTICGEQSQNDVCLT